MANPSRSNTWISQLIGLLLLGLILAATFWWVQSQAPKATSHRVKYRVETSGGHALMTYTDAGGRKGPETVSTPWEYTVRIASGTEVYLTAGNPTQMGSVRCVLYLDGKIWKQESATMPEDKVACAGIVP